METPVLVSTMSIRVAWKRIAYCCVPSNSDAALNMVNKTLASCVALIDVIGEEVEVRDTTAKVS